VTVHPLVLLYVMISQQQNDPEHTSDTHQKHDKSHLWERIANLKIQMIILLLFLLSLLFYIGNGWSKTHVPPNWGWIYVVPWESLASACLGSSLVAFAFEWFIRKETEAKLNEELAHHFREQHHAIANEVARVIFTGGDIMRRILAPNVVDDMIRTGLEIKLGDNYLAKKVYDDQLSQLLTYKERRQNYRCNIYLAPLKNTQLPDDVRQKYYEASIDVRYDTVLQKDSFRFTCVANMEDYNVLLNDPIHELRWEAELTQDFPTLNEAVFDVESITVGGLELNIRRETLGKEFIITAEHVHLSTMHGQEVKVKYRYKVKLQKRGHLLMVHIPCPTQNVVVELDYTKTDIRFVNVLDFFGSRAKSNVRYTPHVPKADKVEIEVNEWIFPKGGVAFVWVLRSEMTPNFLKLMTDTASTHP
jgi:hypothetical protein